MRTVILSLHWAYVRFICYVSGFLPRQQKRYPGRTGRSNFTKSIGNITVVSSSDPDTTRKTNCEGICSKLCVLSPSSYQCLSTKWESPATLTGDVCPPQVAVFLVTPEIPCDIFHTYTSAPPCRCLLGWSSEYPVSADMKQTSTDDMRRCWSTSAHPFHLTYLES